MSPRSQASDGACSTTSDSPPGQNASIRSRAAGGTPAPARRSSTRSRPAPAPACPGRGPWRPAAPRTAAALNASAPIPYTVSVGITTRSPADGARRGLQAGPPGVRVGAVEGRHAARQYSRCARSLRRAPAASRFAARADRASGAGRGDESRPAGQVGVLRDVDRAPAAPAAGRARRRPACRRARSPAPRRAGAGAARGATAGITASPSGPPNTASGGSCARPRAATGVRVGDVGRVASDQIDAALEVGQQAVARTSAACSSTASRRAPSTLRRAQASAAGSSSTASPRRPAARPRWPARARPMPVHRSTTSGDATSVIAAQPPLQQQLGLRPRDEHARPDRDLDRAEHCTEPSRCCSGSRAARRVDQRAQSSSAAGRPAG